MRQTRLGHQIYRGFDLFVTDDIRVEFRGDEIYVGNSLEAAHAFIDARIVDMEEKAIAEKLTGKDK